MRLSAQMYTFAYTQQNNLFLFEAYNVKVVFIRSKNEQKRQISSVLIAPQKYPYCVWKYNKAVSWQNKAVSWRAYCIFGDDKKSENDEEMRSLLYLVFSVVTLLYRHAWYLRCWKSLYYGCDNSVIITDSAKACCHAWKCF